ncbi:MAG: hypothetical protein VST72_03060 [Nitrospirota bacterium]|nr:hypothetical protein [Nitrospirota bacterium]
MHPDEKIKLARTACGYELWKLIRDPHPGVIMEASFNKNLTEEMAVFIAKRSNVPGEVLGFFAGDIRFKDSYRLKLAICKNPKSPQKATFSLLKFLRIFDMGDMTRDQRIPVSTRRKVEYQIFEKISSLPSGAMMALSKRANSNIVIALMEKGDKKVISSCLESPLLSEDHLCRLINRPRTTALLIKMITEHPKWSLRYYVRYALIRNFYTPMSYVEKFICRMKTADLKELYLDETLPSSTRPFIFHELGERRETIEPAKDEIYELPDEED